MNHQEYIESLPINIRPFVTKLIEILSKINGISVYHTLSNKGDLRVRIGNDERVIFTMYWQKQNEVFFCRCYVKTENLANIDTLIEVKITPTYETLLSSFKYDAKQPQIISIIEHVLNLAISNHQSTSNLNS